MALDIVSVSTAIAALSVSGLTISDLDQIPMGLSVRNTPLLIPDPVNPITGLNFIELSFGASSMARQSAGSSAWSRKAGRAERRVKAMW